jgi:Holliday junction resolvasome RuvABC endonuclease subunit
MCYWPWTPGWGETGWAIIHRSNGIHSGLIRIPGRRRLDAASRISQLLLALDQLAVQWRPDAVAHSRPSGIHWQVPALELLESSLLQWCRDHSVPLYAYTAQEVRGAVTGHPNSSRDQLAYAVMARLGLIGQAKSTHEWESIAVGQYHLSRSELSVAPDGGKASGHT